MKKTRVYHNGKRLKDFYTGYTWFQIFVYKLKIFMRVASLLGFAVAIVWIGYNIYTNPQPPIYKAQADEMVVEKFQNNISEMKDEVVNTIYDCERSGKVEEDGLITFDPLVSNPKKTAPKNIASLGTLQLKQTTVIGYYKSLYGKDITMKEAALIALDDEKAKALTRDIIFQTEGGWANWENCGIKHGIKAKVGIIKQLEK